MTEPKHKATPEEIRRRVPYFRPALVPGPFDIVGLNDAIFWLMEAPDAELAQACTEAIGFLLWRCRGLGIALQELWTQLDAIEVDRPGEDVQRDYARILAAWNEANREDPEIRDALAINDVIKAVASKGRTGGPQ